MPSPTAAHSRPRRAMPRQSPIGAFFVLNLLTNSVASLAATGAPLNLQSRPRPGERIARRLRERLAAAA